MATRPAERRAAQPCWYIDRDTASRLGITPQTIDNTLYDAFGQRQVSTMFTQLNQYHVVLEVEPRFPAEPATALQADSTSQLAQRRAQVPLARVHAQFEPRHGAAGDQPSGPVPGR